MAPPVIKLDIADTQVLNSKSATLQVLLNAGFPDDDNTWHIARAVTHLGWTYGPTAHVKVHIEYTPSHYQITVDLL